MVVMVVHRIVPRPSLTDHIYHKRTKRCNRSRKHPTFRRNRSKGSGEPGFNRIAILVRVSGQLRADRVRIESTRLAIVVEAFYFIRAQVADFVGLGGGEVASEDMVVVAAGGEGFRAGCAEVVEDKIAGFAEKAGAISVLVASIADVV